MFTPFVAFKPLAGNFISLSYYTIKAKINKFLPDTYSKLNSIIILYLFKGLLCYNVFHPLHTSIHATKPEYFSNSSIVSSIALLLLPQAGKTVLKRFRELSR